MSTSLRVTRLRLEDRLTALEAAVAANTVALVEARSEVRTLAAAVQAVASGLAVHAADERRHTGGER